MIKKEEGIALRKAKKQIALVLALVMCLAMGLTANAAPSPTGTPQDPANISENHVSVPEGSGVTNLKIGEVPADSPARASLAAHIEGMSAKIERVILVDITAEGSGLVQFFVGKEYAGNHVYLKHYNGTAWEEVGSGVVSKDGMVSIAVKEFSPYAIVITSVKDAAPAAGTTGGTSSATTTSTTDGSATSPKTGETMTILAVELLAAACLVTAIVAGKKVRKAN